MEKRASGNFCRMRQQNRPVFLRLMFLILWGSGLGACSVPQRDEVRSLDPFMRQLETLDGFPYGLSIRDLGPLRYGTVRFPLWFVEDPEAYDPLLSVLVIGGVDGRDEFSMALMQENLNRLAQEREGERIRTDYVPLLNPYGYVYASHLTGQGQDLSGGIPERLPQEIDRIMPLMQHKTYDLVILHMGRDHAGGLGVDLWPPPRLSSGQEGSSSQELSGQSRFQEHLADHISFTLSRVRDRGFPVENRGRQMTVQEPARQDAPLPAVLSLRAAAPVVVLHTPRHEQMEIRIGAHLLAQNTLIRLFARNQPN